MRGNPRPFAHRPLPSIMIAMWRGTFLLLADIVAVRNLWNLSARGKFCRSANSKSKVQKKVGTTESQALITIQGLEKAGSKVAFPCVLLLHGQRQRAALNLF